MSRRSALVLALAGAGLAVPAAAQAATIAPQQTCAFSGEKTPVVGSGFTPGALVSLSGGLSGSGTADATGQVAIAAYVPSTSSLTPKRLNFTATDSANPANTATSGVPSVKGILESNFPLSGKPGLKTTWKFAGFPPGKPIYGHFRFKGVTQVNYNFGISGGPCGIKSTLARRLPAVSRPGTWSLQLDQKRTYSIKTTPRRVVKFTIVRRYF